jgi:diguanylate cyclase (GGDEF)-like protein
MDLDHFKEYNDRYGHLHGDEVLKQVSQLLKETVGKKGYVTRYGGDEFIIILPGIGLKGAEDRVQKAVKKMETIDQRVIPVRFSCGISVFPYDGKDIGSLIDQADKRLYIVKNKRHYEKKW